MGYVLRIFSRNNACLSWYYNYPFSKDIHLHQHEHDGEEHKHVHSHEHEGQHKHNHQHKNVSYLKSMLIGLVHGLAGSGAMVLLTMSTVNSAWEGTIYILIFGVGTVIGMLFFTTIIGIPFVFSAKKLSLNKILNPNYWSN